ncbi:hypothetical protein D3C80_1546240 [compost metagenome]
MLNEIVFEFVSLQQSVVLFLQCSLCPYAVRHVDKCQHGLCIRQRNNCVIQHKTGQQFQRTLLGASFIIETGYELAEFTPAIRFLIGCGTGLFDGLDMGTGFCLFGGYTPKRSKCRVAQTNASVGAKHGNTFGKMVDRFTLYLDQRIVAGLQINLLGKVLKYPGGAALRMRSCNNPQRLAIWQVP